VPYQPPGASKCAQQAISAGSSVAAISHEPSAALLALAAELTCSISVR